MRKSVMAIVVLFAVMSAALAEDLELRAFVGSGSLLQPSLDKLASDESITRGGIDFIVQALYGSGPLKYGIETGYVPIYKRDFVVDILGLANGAKLELTSIPLMFLAQYDLGTGKINPYVMGGLGYYWTKAAYTDITNGVETKSDTSESKLGISLGGGIKYPINDKFDAHLSAKYTYINMTDSVSMFHINLGIAFKTIIPELCF